MMEQAGLSAGEILSSATESGAKLMGMPTELGAVKAGYLADLAILNSNPLSVDIPSTLRTRDMCALTLRCSSEYLRTFLEGLLFQASSRIP
jgi:predicted amidohydrolase YtcJ